MFFFYLNLNLLRNLFGSVDSEYSNMIPKIGKLLQVKEVVKHEQMAAESLFPIKHLQRDAGMMCLLYSCITFAWCYKLWWYRNRGHVRRVSLWVVKKKITGLPNSYSSETLSIQNFYPFQLLSETYVRVTTMIELWKIPSLSMGR